VEQVHRSSHKQVYPLATPASAQSVHATAPLAVQAPVAAAPQVALYEVAPRELAPEALATALPTPTGLYRVFRTKRGIWVPRPVQLDTTDLLS
jgi:hypothetical protein